MVGGRVAPPNGCLCPVPWIQTTVGGGYKAPGRLAPPAQQLARRRQAYSSGWCGGGGGRSGQCGARPLARRPALPVYRFSGRRGLEPHVKAAPPLQGWDSGGDAGVRAGGRRAAAARTAHRRAPPPSVLAAVRKGCLGPHPRSLGPRPGCWGPHPGAVGPPPVRFLCTGSCGAGLAVVVCTHPCGGGGGSPVGAPSGMAVKTRWRPLGSWAPSRKNLGFDGGDSAMARVWQGYARVWQGYGKSMARVLWQGYGKGMGKVWHGYYGKGMARVWQEYGKGMAGVWQGYGTSMAKSMARVLWQGYAKGMARVWQGSGKGRARVWHEYGKGMARVWQRYGKAMARVWQGYGKGMASLKCQQSCSVCRNTTRKPSSPPQYALVRLVIRLVRTGTP